MYWQTKPDKQDKPERTMTFQEAMMTVQALIDGRDPVTRSQLPSDSVFQADLVILALLVAQAALQSRINRENRRAALPPRVGSKWTDEEDEKLVKAWGQRLTIAEIASMHERTVASIRARLVRHRLLTTEEAITSGCLLVGTLAAPGIEEGLAHRPGPQSSSHDENTIAWAN